MENTSQKMKQFSVITEWDKRDQKVIEEYETYTGATQRMRNEVINSADHMTYITGNVRITLMHKENKMQEIIIQSIARL